MGMIKTVQIAAVAGITVAAFWYGANVLGTIAGIILVIMIL